MCCSGAFGSVVVDVGDTSVFIFCELMYAEEGGYAKLGIERRLFLPSVLKCILNAHKQC